MTIKPITTADLHAQLDALLIAAENARPEDFWEFVGALGQLCGVTDRIDQEGRAAEAAVEDKPASTYGARRIRAYHLVALSRLLYDIDGKPGAVSLLPRAMNVKVLCGDLVVMQSGPGGVGAGTPQILYSKKKGEILCRKWARQMFVAAIVYRAARYNQKIFQLHSDLGCKHLDPRTWRDWECETPADTLKRAEADGAAEIDSSTFNYSSEYIHELYQVARNRMD